MNTQQSQQHVLGLELVNKMIIVFFYYNCHYKFMLMTM